MKYITRHAPIHLKNEDGSKVEGLKPLTHEQYVNRYLLNDKAFGQESGFHAIISGGKIQTAFQGNSKEIALEDADYDRLKAAIENPQQVAGQPMSPEMARQYRTMAAFIMVASDKPAKKGAKGKAKKGAKGGKSAGKEMVN